MAAISRLRGFSRLTSLSSFFQLRCTSSSSMKFKQLPSVQKFPSCYDYLKTVLKDKERRLESEDWEVILEDITGTLPATSDDIGLKKELHKIKRINTFSRNRFAFQVCCEANSLQGSLSLFKYLRDGGIEFPNTDKLAFCSSVILIRTYQDSPDASTEDQLIEICNDLFGAGDLDLLSAAIGVLSTTRDWKRGYEKWKENLDNPAFCLRSREITALCLAAIRNNELDILWEMISHKQFHRYYMSVRGKGKSPEHQKVVFLEYIKMLNRQKNKSIDDFYGFEPLFQKFREIKYCDNDEVEEKIETFFKGRKSIILKKRNYSPDGHCSTCNNRSEKWNISKEDSERLKRDIYERTLVLDDAYKNTNPKELEIFFDKLHNLPKKYDVVIDGPNVCLLQIKGVVRKYLDFQSTSLVHVLRELKRIGMNPLVIHNQVMPQFKDFDEISSLCQYILLDKHTKDDPLFMIAALDTRNLPEDEDVNRRFLLTKDTLQQHEYVLSSDEMRQLFTYWQVFHQIPFNIIKEDDAYRVYLYHPKHRDLTATKTEVGSWHIPLSFYKSTEDSFGKKSMMFPKKYLCISKTEDQMQMNNNSVTESVNFSNFLNGHT